MTVPASADESEAFCDARCWAHAFPPSTMRPVIASRATNASAIRTRLWPRSSCLWCACREFMYPLFRPTSITVAYLGTHTGAAFFGQTNSTLCLVVEDMLIVPRRLPITG